MTSSTPTGRQVDLLQDAAPESNTTSGEGDEDWVVLSPHETPAPREVRVLPNPSSNAYLDFQLRTRFGTFSFMARPISKRSENISDVEHDRSVHSQEQSLLFRLPVEIRLEIYEQLMRASTSASTMKLARYPARHQTPTSLTILLTCRRALVEAEEIFYSVNQFSLERPGEFLDSLGPRRRSAVTKVSLKVGSAASMLPLLEQLPRFPNLTSLHVLRKASVKYQDVSSWAIMAHQMIAEIRKMEKLVDFKIWTPEATDLNEYDIARKKKLDGIDQRLCGAAPARVSHAGAA